MTPSCWLGPESQPGPACLRSPSQGQKQDYLPSAGESTGDAFQGRPSRPPLALPALISPRLVVKLV